MMRDLLIQLIKLAKNTITGKIITVWIWKKLDFIKNFFTEIINSIISFNYIKYIIETLVLFTCRWLPLNTPWWVSGFLAICFPFFVLNSFIYEHVVANLNTLIDCVNYITLTIKDFILNGLHNLSVWLENLSISLRNIIINKGTNSKTNIHLLMNDFIASTQKRFVHYNNSYNKIIQCVNINTSTNSLFDKNISKPIVNNFDWERSPLTSRQLKAGFCGVVILVITTFFRK